MRRRAVQCYEGCKFAEKNRVYADGKLVDFWPAMLVLQTDDDCPDWGRINKGAWLLAVYILLRQTGDWIFTCEFYKRFAKEVVEKSAGDRFTWYGSMLDFWIEQIKAECSLAFADPLTGNTP